MTPDQAAYRLRQIAGICTGATQQDVRCESSEIEKLTTLAESQLSQSGLRKWRSRVLERDGQCVFCDDTRHLEAHHCRPKSMFPELAYDDNNGVILCYRCHRVIVHGSNTWDLKSWQRFLPLWESMALAEQCEQLQQWVDWIQQPEELKTRRIDARDFDQSKSSPEASHRSSAEVLVVALRVLARGTQSDDGIANSCIAEAADRIELLQEKSIDVLEWYFRDGSVGGACDPMHELKDATGVTEEWLCRK